MSTLADLIPGKPCDEALLWLSDYSDPHEAIDTCPRLAWLEWLIEEIGGPEMAEYKRVRDAAMVEYKHASNAAWADCGRVRVRESAWADCERVRDAAVREILHAWVART